MSAPEWDSRAYDRRVISERVRARAAIRNLKPTRDPYAERPLSDEETALRERADLEIAELMHNEKEARS